MINNSYLYKGASLPTEKDTALPQRILLHVCCAPCSCAIIETLLKESITPTLFFYNPNIFPREEYELRKTSVMAFAQKNGLTCVNADYDPDLWETRIQGLEQEPERGKRCSACFDLRLECAALYAHEHDFKIFATTNGIGRWKNMDQVHESGALAASRYPGLTFWARNWRENNALQRAQDISKTEQFYKQLYCGCRFSLETANRQRQEKGLAPIKSGETYHH